MCWARSVASLQCVQTVEQAFVNTLTNIASDIPAAARVLIDHQEASFQRLHHSQAALKHPPALTDLQQDGGSAFAPHLPDRSFISSFTTCYRSTAASCIRQRSQQLAPSSSSCTEARFVTLSLLSHDHQALCVWLPANVSTVQSANHGLADGTPSHGQPLALLHVPY